MFSLALLRYAVCVRIAELYTLNGDYAEAADLYERAATLSLEKKINKGSEREYMYKGAHSRHTHSSA